MTKIIAANRKAGRDYDILETMEAGIELKGSEVKSVRAGNVSLNDSFARVEGNEVILYNTHISPYAEASYLNVESTRSRKLLLHRNQIRKMAGRLVQKGHTLVPLKLYFNDRGFVKVELAICKGKKTHDRREDVKRRETDLAIRRMMKNRR
ncbi:MAG: SsrA-binding protein SmpB [Candidatus Omnitrophota bacterium]